MSPTLLEGFVVLILLIVVWQIGVQVAPEVFRHLKQANDQLNKSSEEIAKTLHSTEASSNQEQYHDNK